MRKGTLFSQAGVPVGLRAGAACRYPTMAVTNQAAADKKRPSLSIRFSTLSLSAWVALAEFFSSKVSNNPDKGPTFSLKIIISSTDFPRLNSVSNGFTRIFA